jgi:Cu/Ag efflux pump CusA
MNSLQIKLPVFIWVLIFVLVYIAIKSPSVAVWVLGLPARLISGIGNFFIGVAHSYGAP